MGTSTILTIDIGNTALKAAVYEGERLVQSVVSGVVSPEVPEALMTCNTFDGIAYCCVGDDSAGVGESLRGYGLPFLKLDAGTPLPIEVDYDSRGSLGVDRVAAAVGVASPGEAVLVADAGTAVTVDLVADGHFRGGNISPGLKLRFRSLNAFTSRLPLVGAEGELPVWGHDTTTAIRAGVVRGLVAELRAAFGHAPNHAEEAAAAGHDALRMTLTGGDAEILAPLLSQAGVPVSVDSQAVGRGLVRIFEYNKQLDQRLQG